MLSVAAAPRENGSKNAKRKAFEKGLLEIGHSAPRHEAWTKVMGEEKFAADHYPQDLLWTGAKREELIKGK